MRDLKMCTEIKNIYIRLRIDKKKKFRAGKEGWPKNTDIRQPPTPLPPTNAPFFMFLTFILSNSTYPVKIIYPFTPFEKVFPLKPIAFTNIPLRASELKLEILREIWDESYHIRRNMQRRRNISNIKILPELIGSW